MLRESIDEFGFFFQMWDVGWGQYIRHGERPMVNDVRGKDIRFKGCNCAYFILLSRSYRYVRQIVASKACKYGNQHCIQNATALFRQLMQSNDGTNPYVLLYCTSWLLLSGNNEEKSICRNVFVLFKICIKIFKQNCAIIHFLIMENHNTKSNYLGMGYPRL